MRPSSSSAFPDPVLGTGEVIVDVVAAGVTSYADAVFNGSRNYLLEPPVVPGPGGVGRVRATGPDSTKLKAGDWVFVDSTIRSRDNVASPEQIRRGTLPDPCRPAAAPVLPPRSSAEQMLVPTEERDAYRETTDTAGGAEREAAAEFGQLVPLRAPARRRSLWSAEHSW